MSNHQVSRTDPCPGIQSQIRPWQAHIECRRCARHSYTADPERLLVPAMRHDGQRWVCVNKIEVNT